MTLGELLAADGGREALHASLAEDAGLGLKRTVRPPNTFGRDSVLAEPLLRRALRDAEKVRNVFGGPARTTQGFGRAEFLDGCFHEVGILSVFPL